MFKKVCAGLFLGFILMESTKGKIKRMYFFVHEFNDEFVGKFVSILVYKFAVKSVGEKSSDLLTLISFFLHYPGHALGIWICGCNLFYRRELRMFF